MGNTPHMNWLYPAFRTNPWYQDFVTMLAAIDDTANDHETRISTLESGGVPETEHLTVTGNLEDWRGKSYDNTGAEGDITLSLIDSVSTPSGSICRIIRTNSTYDITLKVIDTDLLLLPDGVTIAAAGDGLKTNAVGDEFEVLKETADDNQVYFRISVIQGYLTDIDTDEDYYRSTDNSPAGGTVYASDVEPDTTALTASGSITDWKGKTYTMGGAISADLEITIDVTGIANGSVCSFVQNNGSYRLILKPLAAVELELPDGNSIGSADEGLRTNEIFTEIEILKYTNAISGLPVLRAYLKKGSATNVTGVKTFYVSTGSQSVIQNRVLAGPIAAPAALPEYRALVSADIPDLSSAYSAAGHNHAHNDTTSKQGGTSAEYYHLTLAQHGRVKYKREIQRLTSADDTTYTLTTSDADELVIVGSGICYDINLGDATTYTDSDLDSKVFRFRNSTPEFIGIVNADKSVFVRLPPRAYCECVLVDNSAERGVWFVSVFDPATFDPAYGYSTFLDFLGGNNLSTGGQYYAEAGLSTTLSGSGANASVWFNGLGGGRQGYIKLSTGTTSTGSVVSYQPYNAATQYMDGACRALEFSVSLESLSVVAEEFILTLGSHNNPGSTISRGAYFTYDRLSWGDFWVLRNINASGNNTVVTAVAPLVDSTALTQQKLRMEVNSTTSRSDFWISNVKVSPSGGLNTYVPISVAVKNLAFGIAKSAGTASKGMILDFVREQSYPTTLR